MAQQEHTVESEEKAGGGRAGGRAGMPAAYLCLYKDKNSIFLL